MSLIIDKFVTIDDVMAAIAKEYNDKQTPRDYIGGSQIGAECDRQTWYSASGVKGAPFDVGTILKFEDGFRMEEVMAQRLRLLPNIDLRTHDKDGKQFGFDLGFIKGHVDGVIRGLFESDQWHVWENKAVDEDGFKKLKKAIQVHGEKNALRFWNPRYYAQGVLYMHGMKMNRHYLTVCTPGGRDFTAIRTDEDKPYAEALMAKAKRIAQCITPPERISERPDFYMCKYLCQYKDLCHAKKDSK